ncbi:MAG TPA: hypothetical protein VF334_13890, partial [Polyangia bacterium]
MISRLVCTLAAAAVVSIAGSVGADVSTAIDHRGGVRREMSLRDAHRCWPRQHFKALSARDRAAVDRALAREADQLGTSAVSDALLRFQRVYLQERNGRIHVYAEPPSVYLHPEQLQRAYLAVRPKSCASRETGRVSH